MKTLKEVILSKEVDELICATALAEGEAIYASNNFDAAEEVLALIEEIKKIPADANSDLILCSWYIWKHDGCDWSTCEPNVAVEVFNQSKVLSLREISDWENIETTLGKTAEPPMRSIESLAWDELLLLAPFQCSISSERWPQDLPTLLSTNCFEVGSLAVGAVLAKILSCSSREPPVRLARDPEKCWSLFSHERKACRVCFGTSTYNKIARYHALKGLKEVLCGVN